jgi:hypothetical protein
MPAVVSGSDGLGCCRSRPGGRSVGGGGEGVRSMGAFGGHAGEEPLEIETAPQTVALQVVWATPKTTRSRGGSSLRWPSKTPICGTGRNASPTNVCMAPPGGRWPPFSGRNARPSGRCRQRFTNVIRKDAARPIHRKMERIHHRGQFLAHGQLIRRKPPERRGQIP